MGAKLSLLAQTSPSIGIFSYIDVLDGVHYITQLNSSKFLKTCKAIDNNGEIVIKVFIKPTEEFQTLTTSIESLIHEEQTHLAQLPFVLNYSKIINSNRAIYLIRQHLKTNLYDRISSRPYLSLIELKFITFQFLKAIEQIHSRGIVHGDLKTENILINSWNWIVITDFSALIKPVYLPEDNPSEFTFYFDTIKRRSCYLAPERFDSKKYTIIQHNGEEDDADTKTNMYQQRQQQHKVTPEMDLFSAGCCIAELFLEGVPLFNLSQLFKYKSNQFDVEQYLMEHLINSQDGDDHINGNTNHASSSAAFQMDDKRILCNLIMDLININPHERLSAKDILTKYRGNFFPSHFYTFTYDYFKSLTILSTNIPRDGKLDTRYTLNDSITILDKCINKIFLDFNKICHFLGYPITISAPTGDVDDGEEEDTTVSISYIHDHVKLCNDAYLELHPTKHYNHIPTAENQTALLFLSFLLHSLRCCTRETTQIKCLELITAMSQFISDENKLDRVIPFLVTCLMNHNSPNVQGLSLQIICQILSTVEELSALNENIFIDYLFPKVKKVLQQSNNNNNQYVKIILANCLGNMVVIAERFQELTSVKHIQSQNQLLQGFTNLTLSNQSSRKLMQFVDDLTIQLLTDTDPSVKIAILKNILPLCNFFGKERTNDIILSHLITYLNDRNYLLRIALIEAIPSVAVLLGPITLEQYILPLLIQSLVDSEEHIILSVLHGLINLCKIGLTSKSVFYDLTSTVCPLVLHPNYSIRNATIQLIHVISQQLNKAEIYCKLYPIIRPLFGFDVEFSLDQLIESCKQPVSRTVFSLLCSWSLRASSSLFWKQVDNKEVDIFGNKIITFINRDYIPSNYRQEILLDKDKKIYKQDRSTLQNAFISDNADIPLTTEDKLWIDKFVAIGTQERDLWKLKILRSYVIRYTKTWNQYTNKLKRGNDSSQRFSEITNFDTTGIVPRNVFFDIKFTAPETKSFSIPNDEIPQPLSLQNATNNTMKINNKHIVPNLLNLHGSLLFQSQPLATTIPDLRNIYVQFDTNRKKQEYRSSSEENLNRYNSQDRFVVENSYEGNDTTINAFIESFSILPSLKEYKEFGLQSDLKQENIDFQDQEDTFVASLYENCRDNITSMVVSSNKYPYLLTGSLHGIIHLWDLPAIVNGTKIESSLKYDCGASITHMQLLPGFETLVVSLKNGTILCLRIMSSIKDGARKYIKLTRIRQCNINCFGDIGNSSVQYENYVSDFKVCLTNEASLLLALTNQSKVLVLDIRNMDLLNIVKNPNSHGAISSFEVDPDDMVLIFGTIRGIIDIWDIRFNILVHSFTFGNHSPITYLSLVKHMGPHYLCIVGGVSNALFTIWDYTKMVCKIASVIGNETPSLNSFNPVINILDKIDYDIEINERQISSIAVKGSTVIISQYNSQDMLFFDLLQPSSSKTLFKSHSQMHDICTVQATVNLMLLMVKQSQGRLDTEHGEIPRDVVTKTALAQVDDKSVLIVSNTQNVINVYK